MCSLSSSINISSVFEMRKRLSGSLKRPCAILFCSLTVDYKGWGMLCFASVNSAKDICFVESGGADAPPPTDQQELMGSGIVGYLHQFPLGRRGNRDRKRVGLFPWLTFHRLAGPLALPYTYMIMKCHIFHSSWSLHFKGQEQSVLSVMWRRGGGECRLSPRWQQRTIQL